MICHNVRSQYSVDVNEFQASATGLIDVHLKPYPLIETSINYVAYVKMAQE